jgi:hypothetical protein
MTKTARPPTARALELLAWITRYCDRHGYSPTVREMCDAFHWSSPNACQQHLERLTRCGLIDGLEARTRTTRPTAAGRAALAEA